MTTQIFDPIRSFEVQGQVCKLLAQQVGMAVGNNQQIVAASSGYTHRIMGWIAESAGAGVSTFNFKSNSGGTWMIGTMTVPAVGTMPPWQVPIVAAGYAEASSGHGIFTDIGTTGINLTLFYISYPS